MLGLITRWLLTALALIITAKLVPGIHLRDTTTLFIAALVLGLVNAIVRPILIFFTLPLTLVTLGLFILVINALSFGIAAYFVPGFDVDGFVPAFVGALLMSILSTIFNWIIKPGERKKED
ncbi:MAG: phage holin family protein [Candidatus Eiseniibacteriota bacterium]